MNKLAEGLERQRYMDIGNRLYGDVPDLEKLANNGKRIAIDLCTREHRFFDVSIPVEALPVINPTWTSIIRVTLEVVRKDH